ncbi:MAG: phosphate--AMP phosphotransferase, partial [Defluviitaleaceae bacterium]|nr:phosphate--AMP phosphotransferase [Defluviitaleaceae bacterium]
RVEGKDWQQNERYDQYLSMFEKMLDMTDTHDNPWHIIESEDRKYSTVKTYRTIISIINARLNERAEEKKDSASAPGVVYATDKLRGAPTGRGADEEYYKRETGSLQKELDMLGNRLYAKRRSAVIVFEGWDAAGKGGCIKRITEELDPRCYEVVPIGAPSQEELSRHYLWRFYNKLPKDGHFAIFDRSWYGRVLVERVERLTPEVAIRRAYREINEMEAHWRRHGALIIKFWLQIGMDEQLKRFSSRQEDPLKRYKITDEDWRNREKWAMYEQAVEEMIAKTDTPNAPWTIVDSNNKRYARMLVLQTVTEALREALK